ncbi:MAG TPA: tetratricopeptide repeat protein, partial [Flavobacteriales bacterium]|nr:tetratricopeptide repeat protein [Flavobacteriales bacterium]
MRPLIPSLACIVLLASCTNEPKVAEATAPPGSLAEIEQRIVADPADPEMFALRARYYEGIDSLVRAESDWKRAIALDTASARWRIALGDLYFRKIRLPEAEERFKEAIRLEPDSTEGRSKLGEVLLMQLRYKEAMAVANEALRIDPQNAEVYNLKGWIHRQAGDTALAISSYQTAV